MACVEENTQIRKKRKRNTYSIHQKLEIIKKLDSGMKPDEVITMYNLGKTTLREIKQSKSKLLELANSPAYNSKISNKRTLHKPKSEILDEKLYEWFNLKRTEGVAISGQMLIDRAKFLNEKLHLNLNCKFSQGWLRSFKERHGIRKLSISGEAKSAADEIDNADETGIYAKGLPKKTLAGLKEIRTSGFKCMFLLSLFVY